MVISHGMCQPSQLHFDLRTSLSARSNSWACEASQDLAMWSGCLQGGHAEVFSIKTWGQRNNLLILICLVFNWFLEKQWVFLAGPARIKGCKDSSGCFFIVAKDGNSVLPKKWGDEKAQQMASRFSIWAHGRCRLILLYTVSVYSWSSAT